MAEFSDFFGSDDDEIRAAAMLLDEAKKGLESGVLTREQFDELVEDALQIQEMDELADNLERKIAIQKAIDVFKAILSAIPK